MSLEDLEPRPLRGQALRDLTREDLDDYSVEDLEGRIGVLKAEIGRSETAIASKRQRKSAADALFNFGGNSET